LGNFTDRDKGWKSFVSQMRKNEGETKVMVGFLRSAGEYKPKADEEGKATPISMAQLGAVHEFGSKDGRIPERSFIRSGMSEVDKKLKRMVKKLSISVSLGRMDKKKALGIVGEFLVNTFKNKIQDRIPPPNKAATVRRKGSDHTLIDTGQMRDSIEWEIQEGKKE
jgi:DNA-nicking Smr family endonuclease